MEGQEWGMGRIDEQKHLIRALWGKKDSQIYSRLLMITIRKVISSADLQINVGFRILIWKMYFILIHC